MRSVRAVGFHSPGRHMHTLHMHAHTQEELWRCIAPAEWGILSQQEEEEEGEVEEDRERRYGQTQMSNGGFKGF